MRKVRKFAFSLIVAVTIFSCLLHTLAGFEDFEDATGHWAEEALRVAYNDSYLLGIDNTALPDGELTVAQAITILNRVLGAEAEADVSRLNIHDEAWYKTEAAKAIHLGLIKADKRNYNEPLSRQDAFSLLADAFSIVEAKPDISVLDDYSDSAKIKPENVRALATLASKEIVRGYEGKLNVNITATRAEFLTVIYRIVSEMVTTPEDSEDEADNADGADAAENADSAVTADNAYNVNKTAADIDKEITGTFNSGIIYRGSAKWYDADFENGIWFDCTTTDIDLNGITTPSAVIRSHVLNSLQIGGASKIERLTLASQSGDITVSPEDDSIINTLAVGTGSGKITVNGIDTIEITGSNRAVTIRDSAELILVSGQNNVIRILPDAKVGRIELLEGSQGSYIDLGGYVGEIDANSVNTSIAGGGVAGTINTHYSGTIIRAAYDVHNDVHDYGISKSTLTIDIPKTLPVNQPLKASATLINADTGLPCEIKWFVDDTVVADATVITGGSIAGMTHKFEYKFKMAKDATVKAVLTYESKQGEKQEISAVGKVKLENYSDEYYTKDVLAKVTLGYKGDFTLEWAENNDLTTAEKEIWVNAKGYTSKSEYLLWINIAYQRVNIFKNKVGEWELIRECIVGTGAPGRGTATGVTTTTYKQRDGWVTGSYMCRPVVRFRPGTGYAFHSRLYYPYSDKLVDAGIGYPISLGCIRMYDEDIWFIFDNIPDGTTVVVH